MSPESTERLLAFMGEHRDDILAQLAPSDQEALKQAFRELGLYATTIPDHNPRELLALSQVIISLLADLPELDEVLPSELVSGSQLRGISEEAIEKAEKQAKESKRARYYGYGPNIANQLHFFVGEDPLAPAEIKDKREGWLEGVLDYFFGRSSS